MTSEARVYSSIWRDPDFTALPEGPQRMYFFLLSQADTSMCGAVGLREVNWASKAAGLTVEAVRNRVAALAAARFVVTDEHTQELLVRAKIRRDEVLKGPKLIKPLTRACEAVESPALRGVIADEIRRCLAEGQVNARITGEAGNLAAALEKSAGSGPAFSQANTLSGAVSHTAPDRARDKATGIRDTGSRGGAGGETRLDQPGAREDADRLCEHLAGRIEANGSKRPVITRAWRQAARLMLDRDGRTEQQVRAAIDWCQDDDFWRANILSMPKLREQYDRLRLRAQAGGARRGSGVSQVVQAMTEHAADRRRYAPPPPELTERGQP